MIVSRFRIDYLLSYLLCLTPQPLRVLLVIYSDRQDDFFESKLHGDRQFLAMGGHIRVSSGPI